MYFNQMYMMRFIKLKNRQRINKAIAATVAMLFMALQLHAQAPGYMGQRIIVGGYFGLAPAWFNYNVNIKQGFTSFNVAKTLELEYIASRRVTIAFHYEFLNVGAAPYFDDNVDPNVVPRTNENQDYQLVKSRAPGIQIKLFKTESKGALAPIGSFFAWDFSLVNYTVWNLNANDVKTTTRQVSESDGSKFLIGMEWGSQRVFFDRVVFRTGFQASLLTGFGVDGLDKEYLNQQRIAYAATFKIGLGLIVPVRHKVD